MAKKKVTHKSKDTEKQQSLPQNQDQDQKTLTHQASMEDPVEKLQNLKSLNAILVKETFERRQQVESLEQAKEALETELTRSKMEKQVLDTELTRSSEESVVLEVEKGLLCVFVETQMREMSVGLDREKRERDTEIGVLKGEVKRLMSDLENERERSNRVFRERDLIKSDLDFQVKEGNGLREKLIEMEKKERNLADEILRLGKECEGLVEVKEDKERVIEAVERENDLVERNLKEMERVVEDLKREIEGILSEKKEIERENSGQKVKIDELEKDLGTLNEIVLKLREEEEVLRVKVLELEKSCGEAMERKKEMESEINALKGEKIEKQRSIERLEEEKNSVEKMFEISTMELKDRVVELHREAGELTNAVFALQEKCNDKEKKNKDLVSEINHYKDAFERVTLEREGAQKGFDEEKMIGMKLMSTVSEMEKKIEESVEDLVRMRNEHEKVIGEKKDLESQVKLLMEENDNVQKKFSEAKHGIDDLRAKMESVGINSERALTMLKNTAALVCQSKEGSDGKEQVIANEQNLGDEIEPYAAALEAIKNSFRNKEATVEDMKKQVVCMNNTVAEAQKKKSFWTVLTSATIFAAASVAYVARGR